MRPRNARNPIGAKRAVELAGPKACPKTRAPLDVDAQGSTAHLGNTGGVRMVEPFDRKPVIARWELHSVATMLIATHGENAEGTAEANLSRAIEEGHEGDEIVWRGVISQLRAIRNKGGQGT